MNTGEFKRWQMSTCACQKKHVLSNSNETSARTTPERRETGDHQAGNSIFLDATYFLTSSKAKQQRKETDAHSGISLFLNLLITFSRCSNPHLRVPPRVLRVLRFVHPRAASLSGPVPAVPFPPSSSATTTVHDLARPLTSPSRPRSAGA